MSYEASWRVLCPCTVENIERAAQKVAGIKAVSCEATDEEGALTVFPTLADTDAFVEIWANPCGPFVTDLQVYSNTAENREAFVEAGLAAGELASAMGLVLESDEEDPADIELGDLREGELPDPDDSDPDEFETLHLLKSDTDWDTATIVALDAGHEELRRVTLEREKMIKRDHPLLKPRGRAISRVRAMRIQRLYEGDIVEQQLASFDTDGRVMTVTWQPIGGPL